MNRINKDNYYLDIALEVSKRSNCLKRHYGCVIVKNDEIIATGYNGSPRGLNNCCDLGFCKRLDKEHNSGDYSDCHSVHAEQNAMLSASRKDMIGSTIYLNGAELKLIKGEALEDYFWMPLDKCEPCPICARMILNSGIEKVVNSEGEVDLLKLI
jgi:dCMP deaminase